MDSYEIVGIREVDYTSKKTGKRVEGVSLHVATEEKNVQGKAVSEMYVGKQTLDECYYTPKLGDTVNVSYNKYGNVDRIAML